MKRRAFLYSILPGSCGRMTKKSGKKPFYQGKSLDLLDRLRKVCYSDFTSKRALFLCPFLEGGWNLKNPVQRQAMGSLRSNRPQGLPGGGNEAAPVDCQALKISGKLEVPS